MPRWHPALRRVAHVKAKRESQLGRAGSIVPDKESDTPESDIRLLGPWNLTKRDP